MQWVRGQAAGKMDPVLFSVDSQGAVAWSHRAEAARGLQTLKDGRQSLKSQMWRGSFPGTRTTQMSQPAGGTGAAEIQPSGSLSGVSGPGAWLSLVVLGIKKLGTPQDTLGLGCWVLLTVTLEKSFLTSVYGV